MGGSINVINNAEKDINVVVNNVDGMLQIVIEPVKEKRQLKTMKPGDRFSDNFGTEYILWYFTKTGDAAILQADEWREVIFGKNNNYAKSNIAYELDTVYLPELELRFGSENIVEHTVDLISLDGLDDYGMIKKKVSIPTIIQYMKYRKTIGENMSKQWWLSTPDSTPSGCGSDFQHYVNSAGYVDYGSCGYVGSIRPFFVLKSSTFVY